MVCLVMDIGWLGCRCSFRGRNSRIPVGMFVQSSVACCLPCMFKEAAALFLLARFLEVKIFIPVLSCLCWQQKRGTLLRALMAVLMKRHGGLLNLAATCVWASMLIVERRMVVLKKFRAK